MKFDDVKFIDINNVYIDDTVEIGKGSIIGPGVTIKGKSIIGENVVIDQNSYIIDSTIGDNTKVMTSYILNSKVGNNTEVGPFSYIRPNSIIGDECKVGDFVEVKNSVIGNNTKASHLTYIGDADLGEGINLGCGVVFVNYNGKDKSRTTVEDNAFIGCNSNLVAPVKVGEMSYIAAGSTVTSDVEPGSLYVARAKGSTIPNWVERRGLWKGKKK